MAYTVLARRYRSQCFDDVIGQEAIARTLKNAIKTNKVAHAYLFCGTRGVGKTTMARILAKSLNCLSFDEPTTTPCCQCDSCVSVNTGEDIDVIEIDGASNTGVDNIRELRSNAIYRPARARVKIYIIDEVHMLSTGAFNALLKILEEPPGHVKFIFATTEPNKVLPTIQSRCQRFDFANISANDISSQLKFILKEEGIDFEDDLVLMLARLGNGSMRDSLSLLDQLISASPDKLTVEMLEEFIGHPSREKLAEMLTLIADSDGAGVLNSVDGLLNSGQSGVQIVDGLIDILRDLMVLNVAGDKSGLVILTESERESFAVLAKQFDIAALIYNVSALEKLRYTVKTSDNPRAILEATLLRLALSENFIGTKELLDAIGSGQISGEGAKKKIEQSAGKVEESQPEVASVVVNASIEEIRDKWDDILEAGLPLLKKNSNLLAQANPVDFDNGNLTLEFPASMKFHADILQRPLTAKIVTDALSKALGGQVRVSYNISREQEKSEPSESTNLKGAKLSEAQRQELLNNQAVKMVTDILDATVMSVEKTG